MCRVVEVAWLAQHIRHSKQHTYVIASAVAFRSFWLIISLVHSYRYSQAYIGFDRVNHSNLILKTTKNLSKKDIYVGPVTFSLAPQ